MLLSQKTQSDKSRSEHRHVRRVLRAGLGALRGLGCIVILVFGASLGVAAQTPPAGTQHQVTVTGTAPSPIGGSGVIAGYNVYKSIAGAAYAKLNTALLTALNYVDTSVTAGQNLSYCMTTVDSKSQESACSVPTAVTVPTNPNPPTLTITSVALIQNGATETVLAKWTDTNLGIGQQFSFSDGVKFRGQGLTSSAIGIFAEELTVQAGTPITFTVCNATGVCASQAAM